MFQDGQEDEQIGIYRNPARGACKVCMSMPKEWTHRVMEETLVVKTSVEVDVNKVNIPAS